MSQISTRHQQAGKPGPGLKAHESENRDQRPFRSAGRHLPIALAAPATVLVLACGAKLQAVRVERPGAAPEPGTRERS